MMVVMTLRGCLCIPLCCFPSACLDSSSGVSHICIRRMVRKDCRVGFVMVGLAPKLPRGPFVETTSLVATNSLFVKSMLYDSGNSSDGVAFKYQLSSTLVPPATIWAPIILCFSSIERQPLSGRTLSMYPRRTEQLWSYLLSIPF